MKSFFAARTLILLVLVTACSSAFAEYKAMATFRRCDLVGARLGVCDKLKAGDSDLAEVIQPTGAEEPDIKACEAIADNINEMEKYHYDWNCGFSISPKSYLLSKPQWVELSESERCDVLKLKSSEPYIVPSKDTIVCQSSTFESVYAITYDLGVNDFDGKIYTAKIHGPDCQHDSIYTNTKDAWIYNSITNSVDPAKKFRTKDYYNSDPVIFSSRLYFVEYNRPEFNKDLAGPEGFLVYAFRDTQTRIEKLNSYAFVCAVRKF